MSTVHVKTESFFCTGLSFFIIGLIIGAGMKAADWLIPSPPRAPLEVVLKDSAK